MNWRNPQDYTYTRDLKLGAWAWEFLRRNPGYRRAWEQWALDDTSHMPSPISTLTKLQPVAPIQSTREQHLALATRAAGEWGLLFPLNPNDSAVEAASSGGPVWRRENSPWEPIILQDDITLSDYRQQMELSPYVHFVALHFERPLKKQIRQLENLIGQYRKNHALSEAANPMSHRENWPLYLRSIDAKDAGATYGQMAQCFFGDSKKTGKARDTLKQAAAVRNGGYRKIALQAFSEPS